MSKRKKTESAEHADVPVPTTTIETAPVTVDKPAEIPKRKRRKSNATDPAPVEPLPVGAPELTANSRASRSAKARTLATLFEGYLQALDERGGSPDTIASYCIELKLAGNALGVSSPVTTLSDTKVGAYFASDPVTKKRNGRPKSPLSIDKTRRVLRQALVWAGHADLVPSMEAAP